MQRIHVGWHDGAGIRKWFFMSLILFSTRAFAQAPFVTELDKATATPKETLTISGLNFGTNKSNVKVGFGGIYVTPDEISDQFIKVQIPFGAGYDNVKVLNTSTGLSGSSGVAYLPSFSGENPFLATNVASQNNFDSESGLYDVSLADFDGDGKQDVATANGTAKFISVFRNTSSPGNITMSKITLNPGFNTVHVAAGDLNGDGKPDILVTERNGPRLFVYKNNSSPGSLSFSLQTITLEDSKVNQIQITDLDLDGKPDVVITDQVTGIARFFVLKNTSSLSTISFAPATATTVESSAGMDGIYILDMNGDQFPDMVTGEFLSANSKIFLLRNASSPGTISFVQSEPIKISTTVSNLCIADFDGDKKPDIAGSLLLASTVMVLKNKSTDNSLLFEAPALFEAGTKPWGIDLGDADGDGKIDIVVASITTKTITVLNNNTTGGTLKFSAKSIPTTFINRHVKFGDIDNDGRSDFIFTSIDDLNQNILASKVSVIRNTNCVVPKISPEGPLTVCSAFSQRLEASKSLSGNYQWFRDGVALGSPSATSFIDVTSSGTYTVKLVDGACNKSSNGVQINVITAAPLGAATITPVSPVCLNGTLSLKVSTVGADSYKWNGPGGFTATGLNVSRANIKPEDAGNYTVDVMIGTCVAEQVSVLVDVVAIPGAKVQFSGPDIICTGESKLLSVFPVVTGFNYQWATESNGNISGATNSTHTVSTTGKFLVKISSIGSPSCPAIQTESKKIRVVNIPTVDFTFPDPNCSGTGVRFENKSITSVDPEDPPVHTWAFGDGSTSSDEHPVHAFSTAKTYAVKLTVAYRDQACGASLQKDIVIIPAPTVKITNPDNIYIVCPGDSIKLEVSGDFSSYLWSDDSTRPFTYVKEGGNYQVEVTAGCIITATRLITEHPAPNVTASVDPESTNVGETVVLEATGLVEYHWTPNEGVVDSLRAITDAVVGGITSYTVYGYDKNGCFGQATVAVNVIGLESISVLKPSSYFTPNGDPVNQNWEVKNMPLFDICSVTIYDERGFKVYEAKPYLNDWEGISQKGTKLAAGVYFYVIRCDDSSRVLTGSINLIR